MKGGHYILDTDGNPKIEEDLLTWARWFGTADAERKIRQTDLPGGVFVSTVFLGLDHSFGDGPALLYETMIFGGPHDQETWRYTTREAAVEGHEHACRVAASAPPRPGGDQG